MPTLAEVDTLVGESLTCLKMPDFRIEREQLGANIHYTVYKYDSFVGILYNP